MGYIHWWIIFDIPTDIDSFNTTFLVPIHALIDEFTFTQNILSFPQIDSYNRLMPLIFYSE